MEAELDQQILMELVVQEEPLYLTVSKPTVAVVVDLDGSAQLLELLAKGDRIHLVNGLAHGVSFGKGGVQSSGVGAVFPVSKRVFGTRSYLWTVRISSSRDKSPESVTYPSM